MTLSEQILKRLEHAGGKMSYAEINLAADIVELCSGEAHTLENVGDAMRIPHELLLSAMALRQVNLAPI
jgi:hypothetical protein